MKEVKKLLRSSEGMAHNMDCFKSRFTGSFGYFLVKVGEINYPRERSFKPGRMTLVLSMNIPEKKLEDYVYEMFRLTSEIDLKSEDYGGRSQFDGWRPVRKKVENKGDYFQMYTFPR